jgi:hypothetical protein
MSASFLKECVMTEPTPRQLKDADNICKLLSSEDNDAYWDEFVNVMVARGQDRVKVEKAVADFREAQAGLTAEIEAFNKVRR